MIATPSPPFADARRSLQGEKEQINTAGYLAGGAPFGPFVSRNLTPRANGMPANLTWEQFREVLRKGTDFKNRHPDIPAPASDALAGLRQDVHPRDPGDL